MEMGQQVLNKDSNEVKRFIEAMEGISKMLDANPLIYRPHYYPYSIPAVPFPLFVYVLRLFLT